MNTTIPAEGGDWQRKRPSCTEDAEFGEFAVEIVFFACSSVVDSIKLFRALLTEHPAGSAKNRAQRGCGKGP
jgi:hypothetical protein